MFINELTHSYMSYTHVFSGMRLMHDKLQPVEWNLEVKFAGLEREGIGETQFKAELIACCSKVCFWLENFVQDCIITSAEDDAIDYLCLLENNIILLCDTPTDDLLAETIHSKLTALSNGKLLIGEIKISASDNKTTFYFSSLDGKYSLPSQEEFFGDEAVYSTPWWTRDDCDTIEMTLDPVEDGEEPVSREEIISDIETYSVLSEFEKGIIEDYMMSIDEEIDEDAEVITLRKDED